nr:hypothetical protein [Tanacetum cinerariifolium]
MRKHLRGHTFATIDIEYEWTPPRCASCKIFDHVSDKCPKLHKEVSNVKVSDDGFTEAKRRSSKYLVDPIKVTTTNSFSALVEDDSNTWDEDNGGTYDNVNHVANNSDNEDVDEYITMEEGTKSGIGVIHQDPQVIHTCVWIKADRKEFFCSIVYAHNYYIHRRPLWNGLCLHKNYINNRPWCLIGDFNASLYVDDTSIGLSTLDITMREFKECVETMEDRFVGAHAIFKLYRISDHSPSFLYIPSIMKVKPNPFKFFNVSILDKRFKDVVHEGWSSYVSGFDMFRVVKKLKCLKKPIRKMMYDKGNLHVNVIRLRENLDRLQTDLDNNLSNASIREEEAAAVVAFNEAVLIEEKFLKQKAKITWLREGDANTAYFHKMVRSRVSRSRIDVVTYVNGAVFQNDDVAKAFINHYEVFLGHADTTNDFYTNNMFSTRLDANEALDMVRVVSSQEVKSAMFSMGNDKSPGPDGFMAAFFKDTWDIIGLDCEFVTNGRLFKELNYTILALIPKVNTPACVNDYKPISSFVPGRSISDNILLTQEIMHNYHLDRGVPRCAFKVDIQKEYDTVDWEFLRAILIGKRGLRQGDPLFPYLFTLVMEVFTLMLHRRVRESSNFTYHRYCSELELINLCFADDLFLFAHGDVNSASIIKEALDEFKDASGLNPKDRLPVKYLGVPLVSSRLIFRDCKELINKVQNRVNDWKNKSLSIAGRLQLIQSVLGSLNVFWASVFFLPSRVLLDIEQIMLGFLWCQGSMNKGKAKVAWEVVCLPKKEGGLGIRRLDQFNKALMVSGKMSWGWRKLLKLRPLIQEFIWSSIGDGSNVFMWFDRWCNASPLYNIISARDIARAGFSLTSKRAVSRGFGSKVTWDGRVKVLVLFRCSGVYGSSCGERGEVLAGDSVMRFVGAVRGLG